MAPSAWRPRLRLLCLHGRQQSSAVFEHRIDKLVSKASSFAEFAFIDGPVELPLQPSERVNSRSWGLGEAGGAEETCQVIEQAWIEKGPFDGVVGFSEGAIASLLCCQMPEISRPNLRFAILAGGPAPCESKGFPMSLCSLHFASAADTHVPIADSRKLAAEFDAPIFVEHTGGHCFPQRSEDIQQVIKFLQARHNELYPFTDAGETLPLDAADDRISSTQLEELDALSAMFTEDEITRVAPAWPVRISTQIAGLEDVALHFTFPPAYPDTCGCRCDFFTERLDLLAHRQELMDAVEAAREPVGVPSVFSMLQAAKDWAEEHAVALSTGGNASCTAGDCDDEAGDDVAADAWWLKEEEVDDAALKAAELKAIELIPDLAQGSWARDCGASGFGRPWQFVIGLVGKPSAGKSTLFNAATRPERPDREASMAPHPFTTIDPNIAPGWFGAPCPSERIACNAQPEHGYVAGQRRKYPLLVKDVAGLVPGAYCGRGRGNAFLNDLVEADSLIHVVDGSGRSDSEGVDQGAGASSPSSSSTGTDPLDEVGWVRREIHLWIFCNVRAKFDSVRRRARMGTVAAQTATQDRLFSLFTGYHASRQLVTQVYEAAGFSLHGIAERTGVLSWTESDLHLMVACFLRVRFPIIVALNKIDLPESTRHVPRVCEALGKSCIPISASSEWWLWDQQRNGHLTYLEGGGSDSVKIDANASQAVVSKWEDIRTKVFDSYGSTGVLAALSAAVLQRRPMFACPVIDFSSYEGLLRAPTSSGYSAGTKMESNSLSTMVMLRPMSTIDEVYAALKHEQMLRGDFVRAEVLEGTHAGGLSTRVLRRDEVLKSGSGAADPEQAVVIKVLTNKKSTWQSGK